MIKNDPTDDRCVKDLTSAFVQFLWMENKRERDRKNK